MNRVLTLFLMLAVSPPPAVPAQAAGQPQTKPEQTHAEKNKDQKKHEIFVLTGTVFTEDGFALAGAQVSVRRVQEKKVRGKAMADRRGEFGVRLRDGGEYEVTVEAKGFDAQSRKFSAQLGGSVNFVFRMQPASGGKP